MPPTYHWPLDLKPWSADLKKCLPLAWMVYSPVFWFTEKSKFADTQYNNATESRTKVRITTSGDCPYYFDRPKELSFPYCSKAADFPGV
jgi:hypothetical protein